MKGAGPHYDWANQSKNCVTRASEAHDGDRIDQQIWYWKSEFREGNEVVDRRLTTERAHPPVIDYHLPRFAF